jgi:hypothetical protein
MYENESGGNPDKFDPETVDCQPLSLIAADAVDRAESHAALVAACTVEEQDEAGVCVCVQCVGKEWGLAFVDDRFVGGLFLPGIWLWTVT